jgi:hypothetical protein
MASSFHPTPRGHAAQGPCPQTARTPGRHVSYFSMLLNLFDTAEIGIEAGGHTATRLPHGVTFGYRAIESEVAPGVSNLIGI